MRLRAWPVVLAGAILAASPGVRAQTPTAAPPPLSEVHALIESPALKDQAWGAWWAATGKLDQLEPALRTNLSATLNPTSHHNGYWNPSSIPDPTYPPWAHYDLLPVTRPNTTQFVTGTTPATSLAYARYLGSPEWPGRGPVTTAERVAIIAAAAPGVTLPAIEVKRSSCRGTATSGQRSRPTRFGRIYSSGMRPSSRDFEALDC